MKILKFFLFALIIVSCSTLSTKRYYLDENGNQVSEDSFLKKWRTPKLDFARWDAVNDTARIARLSHPVFEQYALSYPPFHKNLEKMTGKEFNDSTIFLLQYRYFDDLCTSKQTNNWKRNAVRERKHFLDSITEETLTKNDQLVFLHFFEEGIELANHPGSPEEYFYMDTKNFLKKSIFTNPTLCGSFALVKPNGQVLVRNGEFRSDWMAEYLKEEYWALIFPSEVGE